MKTCLVTEKSIPPKCGKWIKGWSMGLLETCSMITLPASKPSPAGSAPCSCACCNNHIIVLVFYLVSYTLQVLTPCRGGLSPHACGQCAPAGRCGHQAAQGDRRGNV